MAQLPSDLPWEKVRWPVTVAKVPVTNPTDLVFLVEVALSVSNRLQEFRLVQVMAEVEIPTTVCDLQPVICQALDTVRPLANPALTVTEAARDWTPEP